MSKNSPKGSTTNLSLSDNERLKSESDLLRGSITDDLANAMTGGFEGDNFQLIRFHGMYQQDDRDIRPDRQKQKLEPLHTVMLRVRLPGGIISPQQWLAIDEFATKNTLYRSIRITNRQAIQLHGVVKNQIKPVHQLLNKIGLDSKATAGDVNRNVLCTSNPVESELHQQAYLWANKISEHLLPKTNAYAEIWLDGEKLSTPQNEAILGNNYLPRKFKTTVVIPPHNDVDVHANDLNFIAISENGQLIGFNVLVGGGLAMTHGDKSTYPRLATEFGFIKSEDTLVIAEAVVATQRDKGNRSNRRNAKTKYTLETFGVENFKQEVERRANVSFQPTKPYKFESRGDRIGWVKGVDNKHHLTLFISSGRLLDSNLSSDNEVLQKKGVAEIAQIHQGDFRLTPNQNLIIAGVEEQDKASINALVEKYQLTDKQITPQRKDSMACVAFPTCPLAMAEAERVIDDFSQRIDTLLANYNIGERSIIYRVTGCPNGCGRAMLAEVGLIGRALGRYDLYFGGNREGTRIPRLYQANLPINDIFTILEKYIKLWAQSKEYSHEFGEFMVQMKHIEPVVHSPTDFHQ